MRPAPRQPAQRPRQAGNAKEPSIVADALDRRGLEVAQLGLDLGKRAVLRLVDPAEEDAWLALPLPLDGDHRGAGPVLVEPRPGPAQERPAQLRPALRDHAH